MTDTLAGGIFRALQTFSGPGLGRIKGQFLPKLVAQTKPLKSQFSHRPETSSLHNLNDN